MVISSQSREKWTVAIESLTGLKYISDVLYVPDIDQNLLSVAQLVEKGFKVIFEENWCLIKDAKGKDVFRVKMRAKSYALNLMEEKQIDFSSMTTNVELWHKRLRHFHLAELLYMQKHALVKGVSMLEDKLADCVACQYGKLVRKPFPQSAWRATQKLQLVHTDVGGPQRVSSLNGNKYYITFIDDCHTLISSEDHCLMACKLCLTPSRYLAPIVGQYVKFHNVPEVKREHCCTIREVP